LLKQFGDRAEANGFGEGQGMKELANSFAQLAAIIMILITLAVSTAAISQWASATEKSAPQNTEKQPQQLTADSR
jgi:hypothetical protein